VIDDCCGGTVVSSGAYYSGPATTKEPTPAEKPPVEEDAAPEKEAAPEEDAPKEDAAPEEEDAPKEGAAPPVEFGPAPKFKPVEEEEDTSDGTKSVITPADTDDASPKDLLYRSGSGNAILSVSVPRDAKVFVNGIATTTTGSQRKYLSRGLMPGYRYTYEVRAEVTRHGRRYKDTKVVQIRAGETGDLAFSFGGPRPVAAKPLRTSVTLVVPEDAEVTLAGNPTGSTGAVRQFSTTKLLAGQKWSDYMIRVTVDRDGRMQSRERTITLTAGESRTLKFDFGEDRLAAR